MVNKCIFMGRLTADPEFKLTPSGVAVCKFTIAVQRSYAPKDGERESDFFRCVVWRGSAEFVDKYFRKGDMIHVIGAMENNNYVDKDGIKRYDMQLKVEEVSFCGSKRSHQEAAPATDSYGFEDIDDDDLPFI